MTSNCLIDITSDYGLFFVSSPAIYVSLDSNPATLYAFVNSTLGTTSNMTSCNVSFGGPLSSGSHVMHIIIFSNQVTQTTGHGNKLLISVMFDGPTPMAKQVYVTNTGAAYNGGSIPFII